MKLYCATNVVSAPEELFWFGCRRVLATFAYMCRPDMKAMADRNYTGFWMAGDKAREERMKLYLAGNVRGTECDAEDYRHMVRNRLLSYAFAGDWAKEAFRFWVDGLPPAASVFLDCGAYSAHVSGAEISFDDYCDFCERHGGGLSVYVQFDVVGDARQTAENLAVMERRGLRPLPVYTAAAPISDLERLCEKYRYVALGGLRGREAGTGDWRKKKLDEVFAAARRYWPVKFHAFGITAQWVLERYPLYSADSSSVILGAGMGRVHRFGPDEDGVFRTGHWVNDGKAMLGLDHVVIDKIGMASQKNGSAHAGRRLRNIEAWLAFERYITLRWSKSGVVWDDDDTVLR